MADFKEALEGFFSGGIDFEELRQRLDLELAENPARAPEIAGLLEDLLRSDRLPVQVYLSLKERVGQSRAAGGEPRAPVPEDAGAHDQRTRLAPGGMHPATPAAADGDRPPPETARSRTPGVGAVLKGRFVLEQEIGRGGMGTVYRARDLRKEEARDSDPFVAVKVLNEDFQGDPDAFIILQRETKKAQHLAHPNIATVYDFDRDGDTVYMTMEFLKGEPVENLVKRVRPGGLPLKDALPIIEGMAKGLGYAHERNIVHSDFKPGNAFVTEEGLVKVLDFGIARAMKRPGQASRDATLFDPSKWEALTPAYASPEMFDQAAPDPRDDVYALACVAYELLAGRHPFNRLPANQARQRRMKPRPIPGLKPGQNRAFARALNFERNERTPSAAEFMAGLSAAAPASGRWKGIAGLILAGALIGGGAYLFLRPPADVAEKATAPTPAVVAIEEPEAPKVVTPDAETLARIERILEVADLHFLVGRLVEPEGSNAAEAYRAVLEYDPANERALAGLEKIATRFEQRARASREAGDLRRALAETASGLKAYPGHPRLLKLRQGIRAELGE